jgi:hypothetical protein
MEFMPIRFCYISRTIIFLEVYIVDVRITEVVMNICISGTIIRPVYDTKKQNYPSTSIISPLNGFLKY